ncbi:hypothetical protein V6Z90_008706 [Aspergillus fumigatus]
MSAQRRWELLRAAHRKPPDRRDAEVTAENVHASRCKQLPGQVRENKATSQLRPMRRLSRSYRDMLQMMIRARQFTAVCTSGGLRFALRAQQRSGEDCVGGGGSLSSLTA